MTRETKIGLLVALSFLCLVGVVVAAKLRQPEDHPGTTNVAAAKLASTGGERQGAKPTSAAPPKPAERSEIEQTKHEPESKNGPDALNLFPPPPAPDAKAASPELNPGPPKVAASAPEVEAPVAPSPSAPVNLAPPPNPSDTASPKEGKDKNTETGNRAALPAVIPPKEAVQSRIEAPAPPFPEKGAETSPKPAAPETAKTNDPPAPPAVIPPSATNPGPASPSAVPETPSPPAVAPPLSRPDPPAAPVVPQPNVTPPAVVDTTPPTPVPPQGSNNAPPPNSPAVVAPPNNPAPPAIGSVTPPKAPAVGTSAPETAKVKSYSVEAYRSKAGDTFANVSTQVYGSDKYARALLLFNREDPRNRDKGNLLQEPVRLLSDQPVYYPPKEVLEAEPRFAAAIGAEPRPGPAPAANSSSVLGTPTPLITNPGNPNNVAAVPPAAAPPAGKSPAPIENTKRYRVGDNGEHILEIARKTLGDQRRWPAIYQLNPNIRPEYPIPGGTELRLPANASIQ